jgi:hypothetical protein
LGVVVFNRQLLFAGVGALPQTPTTFLSLDTKKYSKKIKSKLSFSPRHDFFFPAHNPGYPPKILPSNAGPGYFDRPSRFRLSAKLRI